MAQELGGLITANAELFGLLVAFGAATWMLRGAVFILRGMMRS